MNDLFETPEEHNPGGKVMLPLAPDVTGGAVFGGPNDCFRYGLHRTWDARAGVVLVIMMNPSTANPMFDDPTIAKVTRMARRWKGGIFGTLLVGNMFAYRATDQAELGRVADPIGPDNDARLIEMARMTGSARLVVFAYGAPKVKALRARGKAVARILIDAEGVWPCALRVGKAGHPWHPLYLPDSTQPEPWDTDFPRQVIDE
jgi:hypothetical protein